MEHILIIQLSRMGDVINTLPLIKSLKEEKENRHITLICYKECSGIIPTPDTSLIDRFVRINIGDIEELAGFDESGKTKGYHFPELTEQYDMVINLAYGEWPAVLCNKIKAKIKFGRIPSKEGEVRQLGDWMKYFFSFIHHRTYNLFNIADIFTRTAHLKNRHVTGYLPLQEADENKAGELLKAKGYQGKGSLIALQIGASKLFRAWELEKFAQLGKVLKKNRDVQVVIIGSKEEQSLADTFLSYADYPVINLVGATTITRLPGILKKCDLLISNDTGPAHIASAVGTKVLGIYFASAYFAETGPYGDGNVVIQTQMPCLPCPEDFSCKTMNCRKALTVEAVAAVAETMLYDNREKTLDFPGLAVYRSQFLQNGTLLYAPFMQTGISEEYQKGLLNRMMWERGNDINLYLDYIDNHLPHLYKEEAFKKMFSQYITELKTLQEIFTIGIQSCDTLLIEFKKTIVTQEGVAKPLGNLNTIETFLDRREEPLITLKNFFNYQMMDMDYLQFPALAHEIKNKYSLLLGYIDLFLNNMTGLSQRSGITVSTSKPPLKSSEEFITEYKNEPENAREAQNEQALLEDFKDCPKDIIIIVKDQYDYVKACIDSIYQNTKNFTIYIWDNGSAPETARFLQELSKKDEVVLHRCEENQGFNLPNNRMAEKGSSPYMILLNSDTVVKENWDKAMIAYLEENPKVAETGYLGGILNDQGLPMSKDLGPDIDYIAGYCLCISRESYDKYGLFDDGLKFAYFEDFDLSIRLKEKGRKLYALHLDLVIHYEGKTVKAVSSTEEDKESLAATFEQNRLYFQNKWKEYLKWKRVAAGKG